MQLQTAIASPDLETEKYIENSGLICSVVCTNSGKVMMDTKRQLFHKWQKNKKQYLKNHLQ